MKTLKIIIAILVVVLAFVAVRNKILANRYAGQIREARATNSKLKKEIKDVGNTIIKNQTASMVHLGKRLKLTNLNAIFPKNQTAVPQVDHPRFVLVFSELSCNVCVDEETRFAVGIASEYGINYALALVHASERRYVQSYIRLNQVNFPVGFSEDDTFLTENGIKHTPALFVVDHENRVLAAHLPVTGHPEYSEPIHQFCYHYFNNPDRGS